MKKIYLNYLTKTIITVWFLFFIFWLFKFGNYLFTTITFPYDWEPTDGDHLNFAVRILHSLPIYLNFRDGEVLSIYTPLYYYLLSAWGFVAELDLQVGRMFSTIYFFLIPLVGFFFLRNKLTKVTAFIFSCLICFPFVIQIQVDLVNLNPNSLMALLFFTSILTIQYSSKSNNNFYLLLSGILCTLCFLAKQQGLIAFALSLAYLIYDKNSFKRVFLFLIGSGLSAIIFTAYLEYINNFNFLRSIFFDLNAIMLTSGRLAFRRMFEFLAMNISIVVAIFFVLKSKFKNKHRLNIWDISVILHIPFLLKILGNGGGGPNYFMTFWISLVFAFAVHYIQSTEDSTSANYKFSKIAFNSILINSIFAIGFAISNLNDVGIPNQVIEQNARVYFEKVNQLIKSRDNKYILSNRNCAAFLLNGGILNIEGSTQFQYAWYNTSIFNKDLFLSNIKNKKYALISTGIQKYPDEVKELIEQNYTLESSLMVNTIYTHQEMVQIYKPKL